MATTVTLKGNTVHLQGELPKVGSTAPGFKGVSASLAEVSVDEYKGKYVILNCFPSIDTGVCAASVRRFNKEASEQHNAVVLCLSKDLPFALNRFCAAEGLDKVMPLSLFRSKEFDQAYGLVLADSPMQGLLARAVIVLDPQQKVVYAELVPEITTEPNYEAALAALK